MQTAGRMTRVTAAIAALAMVGAACGGGDGASGGTPQTEEGAADAVRNAQRALLEGDGDGVLNFMSETCLETVDEDEVRLAVRFIESLVEDEDFELDEVDVETTVEEFDGDTAEVAVEYVLPDGAEDDDLFFGVTTLDVIYENGRWVEEGCSFGDEDAAEGEDLAAGLEALGYAGTRDDPVPFGVGAPVGAGFTVSIDAIDTDAKDTIDAGGGYYGDPDPGNQYVLVDVTVGYTGEDEPQSLGELSFSVVGGSSSVGVDLYGCSGYEGELNSYGTALMSGGVTSGALCGEVPSADVDGLALAVGRSFSDNTVFFDPSATGSPVPVEASTGPQPDAALTEDRQAPIAVGTATDVEEGWTLTVNGVVEDGDALIAAEDFNDPAPSGFEYVLVDLTLAFAGEGSASPSAVDIDVVGDSNVTRAGGSCSVTFEGQLDSFAEVFAPGEVSGAQCFLVASDDVDSLVLLATASWGDDPEVFAIR